MPLANSISYPLAVSPGLVSLDALNPGETYSGEFYVLNPSSESATVDYKITVAPLTYETWNYEPSFSDPDDFNQIVDWISLETASGSLAPQEKTLIKFNIAVPNDAPAGGQYAAFLVSLENPLEEGTASVSVSNKTQVAVLLYTSVAGETREEGYVLENNVPGFYFNQPIKTTSLVENSGNVHLLATYTLRVLPLFGSDELYTNEETPGRSTILPDTVFYSERTWKDTPLLGVFRVQQDIDFGDRIDRSESLVLVAPTWFVVLALAFLASLVLAAIERIHKLRKKTKENP